VISWDGTAPNYAINGLVWLLRRDVWRTHPDGARIRELLRPYLDSADETSRMLATMALPLLVEPEAVADDLCDRLSREQSGQVREVLVGHLADRVDMDAEGTDSCLRRLAANPSWSVLAGDPEDQSTPLKERHSEIGDLLVQVLLHLALVRTTPFASALLASWQRNPQEYPATIGRLVTFCRPYLNPSDALGSASQTRAFELIASLTDSCVTISADAQQTIRSGNALATDERRALEAATWIADALATQIYHASGAFRPQHERTLPDEREISPSFCTLAFPIIEKLSSIRAAAILHHLVQTLVFLSQREPRRAFMAVAKIVAHGSGYEYESIGEQETLDLVDLYLAERRNIILNDPECLSALRQILETFVAAGSDRALRSVQDLAELFA
jgi:hypothetical protein